MLIIHIIVALSSIILAGYTSYSPSLTKLRLTYLLVFTTIGSGTYLILSTPSHMVTTCIEGLVYIFFAIIAIAYSTHKLQVNKFLEKERHS